LNIWWIGEIKANWHKIDTSKPMNRGTGAVNAGNNERFTTQVRCTLKNLIMIGDVYETFRATILKKPMGQA